VAERNRKFLNGLATAIVGSGGRIKLVTCCMTENTGVLLLHYITFVNTVNEEKVFVSGLNEEFLFLLLNLFLIFYGLGHRTNAKYSRPRFTHVVHLTQCNESGISRFCYQSAVYVLFSFLPWFIRQLRTNKNSQLKLCNIFTNNNPLRQ